MQQPQTKKRSPKEMAARAYDLFRRAERTKRVLTIVAICRYTGYAQSTLEGHIAKKYKWFLHGNKQTGYTVNGLGQVTKAEFVRWHTQTIKGPSVPLPPLVIEKMVDRYYRLDLDSVEICLVVAGLLVIGWWWRNL